MKRLTIAWMALMSLMACGSMAFGDPSMPPQPVAVTGTSASGILQPGAHYRLAPKDTVHIKVFQEDDLETTARVDKDGNIAFPLLGVAKLGGLTVQEATTTMETLLREYLIKPLVSVEIVGYSKRRFTILGQVNRPGVFDMPDETSVNLLEAIGMADGYTKIANPSKITIRRIVEGKEAILKLDGKRLLKDASTPTFQVQPGDTIMVGEALF